jgi:uncharacterized OsmC-like protein
MQEWPIEVNFIAKSVGKMRTEIQVETANTGAWDLATDEGALHGGDATAPPPLALFVASLASCLSTQIRAFAKRMDIQVTSVEISGTSRWVALTAGAREPYRSESRGIELRVTLSGDHSADEAHRLVDAAKEGCFVEQTIDQETKIEHLLAVEGRWVSV